MSNHNLVGCHTRKFGASRPQHLSSSGRLCLWIITYIVADMNRVSRHIKFRLNLNSTRNGRCLKIWVSECKKPFKSLGIMVDGITTEQELRRAVETEFSFAIDAVVDFYKNELQGIKEEVQSIRKKDREFIANKRARMRETAKVETADNNG